MDNSINSNRFWGDLIAVFLDRDFLQGHIGIGKGELVLNWKRRDLD